MDACKTIMIAVFVFLAFNSNAGAQVSGISASKLATYNTACVANTNIEFEPAFAASWSSQTFNRNGIPGNSIPSDDTIVAESEFGFRFTYGILDVIEVGMSIPASADALSFGAKYNFLKLEKLSMAALLGYNRVLNTAYPVKNRLYEESTRMAGGLAASLQFDDNFSIDMDGQVQKSSQKTMDNHTLDLFLNLDVGYYLFEWIQPIVGINYGKSTFQMAESALWPMENAETVLNVGFTIEPAENYLMVLNTPFTVAGKNVNKSVGFGFALTITLD